MINYFFAILRTLTITLSQREREQGLCVSVATFLVGRERSGDETNHES
jgi:hypothetical protein